MNKRAVSFTTIVVLAVASRVWGEAKAVVEGPRNAVVALPTDYPTFDPQPSRARLLRGRSDPMALCLNGRDWKMTLTEPGHRYASWEDVLRGRWRSAHKCTVPGSVQSAMLESGARARTSEYAMPVPDYFGTNCTHLTRVTAFETWFQKTFNVPKEWEGKRVHIRFDAVDYDAHFYVNGQEVGSHVGHFEPITLDVTKAVQFGEKNLLVVQIAPFVNGRTMRLRSQIFKNQQGDNNPAASPLGISADVFALASDTVFIENLCVRPKLNDDFSRAAIELLLSADSVADIDAEVVCTVRSLQEPKQSFKTKRQAHFRKGTSEITHTVEVVGPQLWWPNGAGEQNLYEVEVAVRAADGRMLDTHIERFGIRKLEMAFNEGAEKGRFPWTFVINGRKIYAKGGNWAPADPYYRVDAAMYERFILHAKNAHFNMIRWWGGGMPERDSFFDLCDEHGIMLFQDFFLANCRRYDDPEYREFLKRLVPQARGYVRRLRNHPSIVLWTGGNEFPECEATRLLGKVAAEEDPTRPYRPPSPTAGELHGPFYRYFPEKIYSWCNTNFPQVRSEFGSGAASNADAIRKIIPAWELPVLLENKPLTISWLVHCAHCWMDHAKTLEFYGPIKDLDTYCAASQYPRAEGRRYDIEAMRRRKFRTSCTLFWQYNESYANASSNCDVDWFAQPRLHHYFTAKAHEPVHACLEYGKIHWPSGEPFRASLWAISDELEARPECEVAWQIVDAGGQCVAGGAKQANLAANSSAKIDDIVWNIPKGYDSFFVVYCTIRDTNTDEILSKNEYIHLAHHSSNHPWSILLNAPKTELEMAVQATGKNTAGVVVTNHGKVNAVLCTLSLPMPSGAIALFDGNAFCLPPGGKREVVVRALNPSKRNWAPDFSRLSVKAWNSDPVEPSKSLLLTVERNPSSLIPITGVETTVNALPRLSNSKQLEAKQKVQRKKAGCLMKTRMIFMPLATVFAVSATGGFVDNPQLCRQNACFAQAPAEGEAVSIGYPDIDRDASWLLARARQISENAKRIANDGTEIWPPAGLHNFYHDRAYPRDFFYLVDAYPECVTGKQLERSIRLFFNHQRDDGRIPNWVSVTGHPHYGGLQDNSQFLVNLVYFQTLRSGQSEFYEHQIGLFSQYANDIEQAMAWIPFDAETGLVKGGYGFNDTIKTGGGDLFTSLLYFEAAGKLKELYTGIDNVQRAAQWRKSQETVKTAMQKLYDDRGFFYACTQGKNRLPSVWGSAFAAYVGATSAEQTRAIGLWLRDNYDKYVQRGQVRHLLKPAHWDVTGYPKEVYQNGGYWATPFAWVNRALRNVDPKLADRMLKEIVADFQRYGINEVVNFDAEYVNRAGHGGEYCASLSPLIVYRELHADFIKGYRNQALLANGGKATASSVLNGGRQSPHKITHLNDSLFGSKHSWIASDSDKSPWLQIELAEPSRIDLIIFGRDNWSAGIVGGHRPNHTGKSDRDIESFTIRVSSDGRSWSKPIHIDRAFAGLEAGQNHVIKLDKPVVCRFVRMDFRPNSACIDEFEVYGQPLSRTDRPEQQTKE